MNRKTTALTIATGALGFVAALTVSTATALADPAPTLPEPPPPPAVAAPVLDAAAPVPAPAPDATVAAAAAPLPTMPDGVPHLSSPQNLPPGTTDTPDPNQGRGSYLRDLWHAYQTQEISGRDALLLLAQRPMDPGVAPPSGMSPNPTPPLPPAAAPPAPAPDPAPAPLFPWLAPPPAPTP